MSVPPTARTNNPYQTTQTSAAAALEHPPEQLSATVRLAASVAAAHLHTQESPIPPSRVSAVTTYVQRTIRGVSLSLPQPSSNARHHDVAGERLYSLPRYPQRPQTFYPPEAAAAATAVESSALSLFPSPQIIPNAQATPSYEETVYHYPNCILTPQHFPPSFPQERFPLAAAAAATATPPRQEEMPLAAAEAEETLERVVHQKRRHRGGRNQTRQQPPIHREPEAAVAAAAVSAPMPQGRDPFVEIQQLTDQMAAQQVEIQRLKASLQQQQTEITVLGRSVRPSIHWLMHQIGRIDREGGAAVRQQIAGIAAAANGIQGAYIRHNNECQDLLTRSAGQLAASAAATTTRVEALEQQWREHLRETATRTTRVLTLEDKIQRIEEQLRDR